MFKWKRIMLIATTLIVAIVAVWGIYRFTVKPTNKNVSDKTAVKGSTTGGSAIDIDAASIDTAKISNEPADVTTYVVKKGDTLFSICKEYESTCPTTIAVKIIMQKNHLNTTDNLKEGMNLIIPTKELKSGTKYTVKRGDTLFSLARKFIPSKNPNDSVKEIMDKNYLATSDIIEGVQLFIPGIK